MHVPKVHVKPCGPSAVPAPPPADRSRPERARDIPLSAWQRPVPSKVAVATGHPFSCLFGSEPNLRFRRRTHQTSSPNQLKPTNSDAPYFEASFAEDTSFGGRAEEKGTGHRVSVSENQGVQGAIFFGTSLPRESTHLSWVTVR